MGMDHSIQEATIPMGVRRNVVIRALSGTEFNLVLDGTTTVYELKKAIEDWYQVNEKTRIPRVCVDLLAGNERLYSGTVTLDDIEDLVKQPLSLVIRSEPLLASNDDFKTLCELDTDDAVVMWIREKGLAWKMKEPVNLHELDAQTPEEIADRVAEMDPLIVESRRKALGLNNTVAAALAFEEAPGALEAMRMAPVPGVPALDARGVRLLHRFLRGPAGVLVASWFVELFREIMLQNGNIALQDLVTTVLRMAEQSGHDEEHVGNIMLLVCEDLDVMDARAMIAHLVRMEHWCALEEQLTLQPELLSHQTHPHNRERGNVDVSKLEYFNRFPRLYESVLPKARWGLVKLLLEVGLNVDLKTVLLNMSKVDARDYDACVARLKQLIDVNVDPKPAMAWAAGQEGLSLKMLLDANVDPSMELPRDTSMLYIAIQSKREHNIRLLLDIGIHMPKEVVEMVQAKTTEQETLVDFISSRQEFMYNDFPYLYDDRRKKLEEETSILRLYKEIVAMIPCPDGQDGEISSTTLDLDNFSKRAKSK